MNTTNKLPKMYDVDTIVQAGIDPTTGMPIKAGDGYNIKSEIRKQLRVLDEQDAVNRYVWYNVPKGLNSRLIERILYYRGQGMFFKLDDSFYFLPYALDGTIDVYGRFTEVTPLPFNGRATADPKKEKPWITGLKRKVLHDVELQEDYIDEEGNILVNKIKSTQENACVLIKDYTEQISQTNISRQVLQDPILDVMSDMIPFMRTALLNATGVQGMRVTDQSEYSNVEAASRTVNRAALTGQKYIAIVGSVEFQDLTGGEAGKAEEFLLALQGLDNYRLSLYGLKNGGLFQKKSHMLEEEQNMNDGNVGLVFDDGLKFRQEACNIINSVWGLGIWCEPNEVILNMDIDGDMMLGGDPEEEGTENAENVQQ